MLKKIIAFDLIILTGFILVLYWMGGSRYDDYYQSQRAAAIETTNIVLREIEKQLKQKKLLVSIFLEDHFELVTNLASNPKDEELFIKLNKKLKRFFPDYFSANIATDKGSPVIDDFEGNLGELCIQDMQDFAKGNTQNIRIHPHPNIYHYDILIPFEFNDRNMFFFVSFNSSDIASLLLTSQLDNHKLMLINEQKQNLIEILDIGARNMLKGRLDYRLTTGEMERILTFVPVNGTRWQLIDLYENNLFKDYKNSIIRESATIFIMFSLIVFVLSTFLYIGERKRLFTEQQLEQQNAHITKLNKKLSKANEELEHLSVTDQLTGLFNRRYLDNKLEEEWDRAKRLNLTLVLTFIDVDYFKQYNDMYGHQAGDECLKIVANMLSLSFRRANDFIARYGGEEFAVVTIIEDQKAAIEQVKKFREAIEDCNLKHSGSEIADHLTVSAGVSYLEPDSPFTLNELINNADRALYSAKEKGRNLVVDFNPTYSPEQKTS